MSVVRETLLSVLFCAPLMSAAIAGTPIEVEIKAWKDADRNIELIYRGKERTVPLAANVRVVINGKEASLDKLPVNRHASVVFDNTAAAITCIAITSVNDDSTAVAALKRSGAHFKQDALGNVVEVTSHMVKDRSKMTDAWLASVNWKGLPYVTVVRLDFTPVTDAGLRHLSDIENLKEISLQMTQVTDSGIRSLQSFPILESLAYGSYVVKGLTGKSLQHVSKIKRLLRLDVGMVPLSNADLAELANLTNLKHLSLRACRLSDEGLSFLPQLKELRSLDLSGNGEKITNKSLDYISKLVVLEKIRFSDNRKINDDAMNQIKELKNLRDLNLNGTRITDAGLIHLNDMTQLQELQVGGTGVTDAGLVHIQRLAELQMLNISGTRTTKAGLDSLQSLKKLGRIVK